MTTSLLLTVGAILLLAPAAGMVAKRFGVPRVTLLILLGLSLGPLALDVLPDDRDAWYPVLAEIALAMVGFLLGGEFTLDNLRKHGRAVLVVSIVVSVATAGFVGAGMWLLGASWAMALVLGTAATATDPAAVDAVCRERGTSPLISLLRGVVAVDDVWGMLLFAVALAGLGSHEGGNAMAHAARELGLSIGIGIVLGIVAAYVTGRVTPGEPTRLEALGSVLLCCGLASYLGASYLLAAVTMGSVVANFASHHERAFHEIEEVETPFLVLFFVLSGASARPEGLSEGLMWTLAYIALRVIGRVVGGWIGVVASAPGQPKAVGLALLPQAGVALGMTLVAVEREPSLAPVLPIIVLGTVFFESLGPLATAWLIDRDNAAG